jgi:hypothetical protein
MQDPSRVRDDILYMGLPWLVMNPVGIQERQSQRYP